MRINRSRIVWGYALFVVSLLVHGEVCFGQKKEAVSMDTKISGAEDAWNQGNHSKYYSNAAAIAREIKANPSKANMNGPASKLLGSLLSKQADLKEVGTSDLSTMKVLAACLASNDDASINERRLTVRLLCKYLGKVRKERVPDFKPKPVEENVAPPPGVPGFAGMSPDAIKDPAARAKYEQAIRENQDSARQNSRQAELEGMEWAMHKQLKSYMLRTFKASDVSSTELLQCMSEASFDEKERKDIEGELKRKAGTK